MADDNTQNQQDQRDADQQDTDDSTELQAAGKAALEREREARREADKRAKAAEKRLNDLEAAAQKAADDKAAEEGKFKELAERREADLTTVSGERDSLKAELDTLRGYVSSDIAGITKQVKDLKDDPAAKTLLGFHPGDEATVTQLLAWAAVAKQTLPEIAEARALTSSHGNGPNPTPAGNVLPEIKNVLPKRQLFN